MVHIHYVLCIPGAPRFDDRSEILKARAAELRRGASTKGVEQACDISDILEFFSKYVNEWNLNKDDSAQELVDHVAERVNQSKRHPASYSAEEMIELLQPGNADKLEEYYKLLVRAEHMHDYHYPDANGPPNSSQACAVLVRGTTNMFHCKNGYPRDLILQPCFAMVKQDDLRPDLWRAHLERNCPTMNSHQPVATIGNQANTDKSGVLTRNQVDMYLTKYCAKPSGNYGCRNVLYDVYEDMQKKDARLEEDTTEDTQAKLGPKMHRAFMAEAGAEMCQAEVAHHANRSPEYLCSRPVKDVHLYKQSLAISDPSKRRKAAKKAEDEAEEPWAVDDLEPSAKRATKPSDLEVYEKRTKLYFAEGTPLSPDLPEAGTPEEQVEAACVYDFFRLVRLHGGSDPWLEWFPPLERPIVLISPTLRLNIEGDFPKRARWSLLQYHAWKDRNHFLNEERMTDEDVVAYFNKWIFSPCCPWYITEQYQKDNNKSMRTSRCAGATEPSADGEGEGADDEEKKEVEEEGLWDEDLSEIELEESDVEDCNLEDERIRKEFMKDAHVLRVLRAGHIDELPKCSLAEKKSSTCNSHRNYYRNTRCTDIAQEESSANPGGVLNVHEDSDEDEAFTSEQKEIEQEMDALRGVHKWMNPDGWDLNAEGKGDLHGDGSRSDLRRDWGQVKKLLDNGAEAEVDGKSWIPTREEVERDYDLARLDPTQRAFVDYVLSWVQDLISAKKKMAKTKKTLRMPKIRAWLGGSAGSGKSTTVRTAVQHARLLFHEAGVAATVELTAYTGVAAFNIGFGAKTTCSAFQVSGNTKLKPLQGEHQIKLERDWTTAVLLIVDETSFIGQALFHQMHCRLQQAKRRSLDALNLNVDTCTFGDMSMILVGDFGQLDPIHDWSLCDTETKNSDIPAKLRYKSRDRMLGKELLKTFDAAFMLTQIHRSADDAWWTESCLRLRDFKMDYRRDYSYWLQHDLRRGHFTEEEKQHFDDNAVWICAKCEKVGSRNGRKLAKMVESNKSMIHKISARHSNHSSAKRKSSSEYGGLRPVLHLSLGCKVVLARNVAYLYGLANGTRGKLVSVVYAIDATPGSFPEALIVDFPDYKGPAIYEERPTWVPILPKLTYKDKTKMWREQFPITLGFAMTINKSQGLTLKEGVVIDLEGSQRFKPASKHGLAFVAFTRSESFAKTAFSNLPPFDEFKKGEKSDMLRMRQAFIERLTEMHQRTLAGCSKMKTAKDERRAAEQWRSKQQKNGKSFVAKAVDITCAACNAAWS